jgi:DEAD/DEAH box helicase domain-containing protein
MKRLPVILDVETKYTFRDFNDPRKLGISIAVLYDYADNQPKTFFEKDLGKLFSILENTSYVIGYNVKSFDMNVLQGYYPGNIEHFTVFDMLDDIREKIGRRLALNDLVSATLNKKKSGHGLMAIDYFKEGKFEELKNYCTDDVMYTKELFEYGVRNGVVSYLDDKGKVDIKVNWKKYLEEDSDSTDIPLTLPF